MEFRGRGGVSWTGILKAWGGGGKREDGEEGRGKTAKASLKITDLLTFLVCKSSTTEPQKQEAEVSIYTDGLCSKVHIEEALKLINWSID